MEDNPRFFDLVGDVRAMRRLKVTNCRRVAFFWRALPSSQLLHLRTVIAFITRGSVIAQVFLYACMFVKFIHFLLLIFLSFLFSSVVVTLLSVCLVRYVLLAGVFFWMC